MITGIDQEVGVTVYTSSMNSGGKYQGKVTIKGEQLEKHLPVKVEIETKHLNLLAYLVFVFFTLLSFVPVLGFLGFIYNFIAYLTLPSGERKSVKVFFYVSLFTAIIWLITASIVGYGIINYGWFKDLIHLKLPNLR
jgi:hypothetical protein